MGAEADAQEQVAAAGAAAAAAAFAGHPNQRAVGHTGGDAHLDAARLAVVAELQAMDAAPRGGLEIELVLVLDVAPTLAARPWTADGETVLEVSDPQGHAAGRYAVVVRDGAATVTPTDVTADVSVDAETLGSLSVGGVGVTTLHAAGRVTGEPHAVAAFAAMADLPDEPYNILGF